MNKFAEEFLTDSSSSLIKPYSATTDEIRVTVWPEFINNKSILSEDLFVWSYQVRIENNSSEAIKLISRFWRIIDETGSIQEIKGDGVIGEQPTIAANKFYNYSSVVHLKRPSGIMAGKYKMRRENGEIFEVTIPSFSLDIPSENLVLN